MPVVRAAIDAPTGAVGAWAIAADGHVTVTNAARAKIVVNARRGDKLIGSLLSNAS
jgi:hypothetical protein